MFPTIEAGLVVVALALAVTAPKLGSRWFESLERFFGNRARKRGLPVVVVGLTALSMRVAEKRRFCAKRCLAASAKASMCGWIGNCHCNPITSHCLRCVS